MDVLAAYAASFHPESPLDGLVVGDRPEPVAPSSWTTVEVKAASLNHHDLWTLRGVGLGADRLPMILGSDAAGTDLSTGADVIVHSVIPSDGWAGDETLDPKRTLLSEKQQGTFAQFVIVPTSNVVPKPAELSFVEAACLPTAWLTAYRMLFVRSGLRPGQTVLVQGATGGVASACIALARVAGLRVWATTRTDAKQAAALELGAHEVFPTGVRLPERVDAVLESVGEATWAHSVKALKPGGRIVVCGATSGPNPPAELTRIFFLQLSVVGSTMGTRGELTDLVEFLRTTGLRPRIDRVLELSDAGDGLAAMAAGELVGKIVLRP
jgi:NADPH:quinone reductase-like Zn-dependent oxidoreductase